MLRFISFYFDGLFYHIHVKICLKRQLLYYICMQKRLHTFLHLYAKTWYMCVRLDIYWSYLWIINVTDLWRNVFIFLIVCKVIC